MVAQVRPDTPAFPCDGIVERDGKGHFYGAEISSSGMTLRDYFAAKAMQGMIESEYSMPKPADLSFFAESAYQMADAMLMARES